eukprot:6190307-Prymnesium_polylepis.1
MDAGIGSRQATLYVLMVAGLRAPYLHFYVIHIAVVSCETRSGFEATLAHCLGIFAFTETASPRCGATMRSTRRWRSSSGKSANRSATTTASNASLPPASARMSTWSGDSSALNDA